MRIAIDVRPLLEGRQSGVQVYTQHLLQALQQTKSGHEFLRFSNQWREAALPAGELASTMEHQHYRIPSKILTGMQALGMRHWDRVIAADVFLFPNLQLLPARPRKPAVGIVHDLSFARFPEFLSRKRQAWHTFMRPRQFFERTSRLIAVSEHTKWDLMYLYDVPEEKITVIHSGIAGPPASSKNIRSAYNLPERYVLYVGAFEPRKNIAGIIEAFGQIAPDVPHGLVLAGETGWREKQIEEVLERSTAADRIHRIGRVAPDMMRSLYEEADLFVYPSFYEGFGFPPLEALVAGTPVLTSFNSSLPEIVGQWAVMVDPYATAQLADMMREMLVRPQAVPQAVREEIAARYRWDTTAKGVLAVLKEVAV